MRFILPFLLLLALFGCGKTTTNAPALSPQDSLKTFHVSENFHVELFAAEPQVIDPVEMVFDENGRIYVAEMIDYPDDPPRSRIRLLEDTDGDGKIDRSVFDENCAKCHMPRKQGGRVGPDLSGINNKTGEELLTSILNPRLRDRAAVHALHRHDEGRHVHDGVLANETPAVITLRGGTEEGDETILRANIQEIRASSVSLMPEELEKSMNRPGLADVIAYLRGGL